MAASACGQPAMPPADIEELKARHAVRDAEQAASRARASQSGPFGDSRNARVQAAIQQVVEATEARLREAMRQQSELLDRGRLRGDDSGRARAKEQQLMAAYCTTEHKAPRKKKKARQDAVTLVARVVGREPVLHDPQRTCCTTVWASIDTHTTACPHHSTAADASVTNPSGPAHGREAETGPPAAKKRSHKVRAPPHAAGSNFERRVESRAARDAERRAEVMAMQTHRHAPLPPAAGAASAAASFAGAGSRHGGSDVAAAHTEARSGGGEGVVYPPALRSWIVRSLSGATDASQSVELQRRIKMAIATADREGTIWQTDWEVEPLVNLETHTPPCFSGAASLSHEYTSASASAGECHAPRASHGQAGSAGVRSGAAAEKLDFTAGAPTEARAAVEVAHGDGRQLGTKHRREPPPPLSPDASLSLTRSATRPHADAACVPVDARFATVGEGSTAGGLSGRLAGASAMPGSSAVAEAFDASAAAGMSRVDRIAALTPSPLGKPLHPATAVPIVASEGATRSASGRGAGYLSRGTAGRPGTPGVQGATTSRELRCDDERSNDGEGSAPAAARTSPRTELRLRRQSAASARADRSEHTSDAAAAPSAAAPHLAPVAAPSGDTAATAEALVTSRVAARRKAEMARSQALAREVELPPAAAAHVAATRALPSNPMCEDSSNRCYFGPGHAGSADATAADVETIEVVGVEAVGLRRREQARPHTWEAGGAHLQRGAAEAVTQGDARAPASSWGVKATAAGPCVRSATFGGGDNDTASLLITGSGAAPPPATPPAKNGVVPFSSALAGAHHSAGIHRAAELPPPLGAPSGAPMAAARAGGARLVAAGSMCAPCAALNRRGGSTGSSGTSHAGAESVADGGSEQLNAARERMARLGLSHCGSAGALGNAHAVGTRPSTGDSDGAWHWPWARPSGAVVAAALGRARPASARHATLARPSMRPASAGAIRTAGGGIHVAGGGSRMFHALSADGGGPEWKREERELEILLSALGSGRPLMATMAEPCCICLEGMCAGNLAMTLPCSHVFHSACIMRWLHKAQNCPLCKDETLRSLASAQYHGWREKEL